MGGRARRRHVGLEALTLPTLSGCKSRRERHGSPVFLAVSLEPEETCRSRGGCVLCVSLGGGGLVRHPRGREGSRDESIRLRGSALQVLTSFSEASGRSSRASVSPSVKWSWAFLPHPPVRQVGGLDALGNLAEDVVSHAAFLAARPPGVLAYQTASFSTCSSCLPPERARREPCVLVTRCLVVPRQACRPHASPVVWRKEALVVQDGQFGSC